MVLKTLVIQVKHYAVPAVFPLLLAVPRTSDCLAQNQPKHTVFNTDRLSKPLLFLLLFQYIYHAREKYTEISFPLLIADVIYQSLSKP